jgi:hypothetical protein
MARLRVGEWVEIRSKEEILATLDENGQFEGLPFMPEMFPLCGKRFRVVKRAHKTCDPPDLGGRRMERAVHLEGVRCGGAFHGGCQARCMVFWKDAWLKRVTRDGADALLPGDGQNSERSKLYNGGPCTEADVIRGTRRADGPSEEEDPSYVCQATQLRAATQPLSWWTPGQYLEDYFSGNVRIGQLVGAFWWFVLHQVVGAGIGLGTAVRWVCDVLSRVGGGVPYPWRSGEIPTGQRTPSATLTLKPGELVKVKPYQEILETLDEQNLNRGMIWDAEMVPYCGGTYRVLDRISRIINERTGKMNRLRNDCLILEDVTCHACFAKYRRFCSRGIYPYWREIWLQRVSNNP